MKKIKSLLITLALSMTGCASTDSYNILYGASVSKPQYLKKLLILPADIAIKESFAGNLLEDIPLWANTADQAVMDELANTFGSELGVKTVKYQDINDTATINEYLPLIKRVSQAVRMHSRGFGLWQHKMEHFDYTIGNGLNALRHKEIDAALYISGYQSVEAFRYDGSKDSVYSYRKADLSFGDLYLSLILIDVNSGELLWTYFGTFSNVDSQNNSEVRTTLSQALVKFPSQMLNI